MNETYNTTNTILPAGYLTAEEMLLYKNLSMNTTMNETLYTNQTIIVLNSWYPSGYSPSHIIIASIVVTFLMIMVVVGNMLVIIAICTEKSLKTIQNWFIASLALSDFFLGVFIMPFSLANELMGYWIFGFWWCEIHAAMDVLLCTAQIMNLCLISLDRYWSITQAIEYLKKRTPARAIIMIASVWIMSALVSIPPLLGWRVTRADEMYPKCKVSDDLGYVLYSSLGSFYIPSCIMVFVYIRIYYAAKARARRGIRKKANPKSAKETSFNSAAKGTLAMPASAPMSTLDNNSNRESGAISTIDAPQPIAIPTVTCDYASDISTSEACEPATPLQQEDKYTLKVVTSAQVAKSPLPPTSKENNNGCNQQQLQPTTISTLRTRAPSMAIDADMVSEFDPSSSDSGVISRCAVVKPLKQRICQPLFGRKADLKSPKSMHQKSELEPALPKPHKPKDPEREKRRMARKKEKRATLILGLIMGSFIACWLPFFLMYLILPICHCEIPEMAFAVAFWLGYMNSVLNPVIYTIFNKDFRRAFRRILFK